MCKIGDIILINNFKVDGMTIPRHSFIVIEDSNGQINGLPYDFISVIMTSIKNNSQEFHKLGFPGNFYLDNSETNTNPNNGKDSIVMTDIFYYFNKNKITYQNIGSINNDILEILFDFIETSEHEIRENYENL